MVEKKVSTYCTKEDFDDKIIAYINNSVLFLPVQELLDQTMELIDFAQLTQDTPNVKRGNV